MFELAVPRLDDVPAPERTAAIVRWIKRDVGSGRLRAGQKLPGVRPLAQKLGVHKNTVLKAIDELCAMGFLKTVRGRGTFVDDAHGGDVRSATAPVGETKRNMTRERARSATSARQPSVGSHLFRGTQVSTLWPRPLPPPVGGLSLAAGVPDARLFPVAALTRAWRRVASRHGRRTLDYGPPEGHPALRTALASMLANTRALSVCDENVLVTRGSQMALDLLARVMFAPGDVVVVERLGYSPAWDALALAGATLIAVDVDADGMNTERLKDVIRDQRAKGQPVRAVYVTPHHQYPTMVTMSAARRARLLSLARAHAFVVIEDDYDHEFHYDGSPVFPLYADDERGVVIMIGTLSKILAPGLRMGFVVAPSSVIARLALTRKIMDRQGDLTTEAAVAELIDDGELARHVKKMRHVYRQRRDHLMALLHAELGDVLFADVPRGGIGLWAHVPDVDTDHWAERARARDVVIGPGSVYAFDRKPVPALRFAFASLTESELERGVAVLKSTVPSSRTAPRPSVRKAM